ncbi:MAG: alpha/beta hydrolase [Saonia sp.]
MQKLKKIGGILLIFFVLILTMLYLLQEKLIFLPTRLAVDYSYSFTQPFEEVFLTAADGAKLNAVHFKREDPKGVILYFHGNAGDLSRWGHIASFFAEKGYDVVVMDYRTYGKSTGKLSERVLHEDAQLFYDYLLKRYNEDSILLYGRSLGTGIATRLASRNKPVQLILETPYYSLMDIAKERFPFLPLKWLLKYKFQSFEYIQSVTCPVVIFHGTQDAIVPYDSGKRLFDTIPGAEKKMYTITDGGHNNLITYDTYLNGIDTVLGK